MNAIDILVKEHDSILKMIEIAKKIFSDANAKENINVEHVDQIIDFIRNFADKYHHLKEEDRLFIEMEKRGMPRQEGPIGVMLMEHDEGRSYVRKAKTALEEFKAGNKDSFEALGENLLNYCELLINHIHKENNILYPMAQQLLPPQTMNELTAEFEHALASTSDNEYHDKYLKMVDDLTNDYLS